MLMDEQRAPEQSIALSVLLGPLIRQGTLLVPCFECDILLCSCCIAAFLLANHQQDMPQERIVRHRLYLLNGRVPGIVRQWGFAPYNSVGKKIRQCIKDTLIAIWNYTIFL